MTVVTSLPQFPWMSLLIMLPLGGALLCLLHGKRPADCRGLALAAALFSMAGLAESIDSSELGQLQLEYLVLRCVGGHLHAIGRRELRDRASQVEILEPVRVQRRSLAPRVQPLAEVPPVVDDADAFAGLDGAVDGGGQGCGRRLNARASVRSWPW